MIEIPCPLCDEVCRMEVGDFHAEVVTFRCEACRIQVDLDRRMENAVRLAA